MSSAGPERRGLGSEAWRGSMGAMDSEAELAGPRLRLATPGDAEAIARIYGPWVREPSPREASGAAVVSFEIEPPSPRELALRIASVLLFYPWLVLELDEQVVAYAYATRLRERPAYDWIAETSVYVDRGAQRRGFGEQVYSALLDLLAMQGLIWAYGAIVVGAGAAGEGPSQRFHARLGFERFGRFPGVGFKRGRWWDIEWWRFALAEATQPEAIRPLCDPRLREAVAERLAWGEGR